MTQVQNISYKIEPVNVNSATQDALAMQMLAVSTIHLIDISGNSLSELCYCLPDVSGTIISPDATARQHCKCLYATVTPMRDI